MHSALDIEESDKKPSGKASPPASGAARISASDRVFRGIVRGLEVQEFIPGQRLVEVDLMQRFGVGRNSIREAMQRLYAEGVVELSRHKGAAIRILSREEMLDLLDIAEALFGVVARKAVRGAESPEYSAQLRAALDTLSDEYNSHDARGFLAARRRFYRALLDMGGSSDLARLFTTIHLTLIYAQQRMDALKQIRLADYRVIGEAVLAGAADDAAKAGARHVENVRKALIGQFSD